MSDRMIFRLCVVAGLIFTVMWLAGCTTRPVPPPAIVYRTVEVDRPIPVPCLDATAIPAEPPKVGARLNGNAAHDLDIVGSSAQRLRAALETALALLGACIK